jgi:hypothetical protein
MDFHRTSCICDSSPRVVVNKHSEALTVLHTLHAYEEQEEDAATSLLAI